MLTGLLWLPPAAADELDASAPYSTQSPGGYTDTGKQQVILSFYNEQGTGQCTGNGCGDADVPPPSDVPHGPPPGIEPQAGSVPLHVMMSPIGGGLQKSLNDVISKALGVNNTGPLGAALVRGAHIDDWVGHQMPQAEAGIKDQVTRIWRGGRFFSHKQLDAMDTKLSALTGRINSGHFGPTDLTDIVIHVPASHDLTRNAISQQLATVIANYQAMSDFCQNGDFCNWHFDKNGYLNSYQALAEAAEEPDYELYLVTIESNVDAADRALRRAYNQARRQVEQGGTPVPAAQPAAKQPQDPIAQRAQETAVTALRQSYNSTMPTSPIGVAAKAAGLRALSRASGAENQQPADAASYLDIARSLFDLLVSGTPGVGLGRDIYEAVSGRNMLSDAELTDTDRLLAVLGVLSASAIDEPLTVVRTLRRIADHKEFFLDKSLTRIRSFSSETVNRFLETKYNYTEPPYRPDARVFRYETTQEERFVRFYTPGQSSKDGPWIMRPGDVEGLSMQDIARKFGLPDGRTHWVDVDVPAGTLLERGPTNKAVFGGDPTVSYQYRLIDPGQVHFGEGMPVKDPFTRK